MSVSTWRTGALSTGARTGPLQDWSGRTIRTMPAGSVEFLRVPIQDPHHPDAVPAVRLAFTPRTGAPVEADWQPVTFEDGWARILTTGQLPAGEHMLWAEITDHPQRVYRAVGLLTITRGPGPGAPVPEPSGEGYFDAYFGTYLGDPATGVTPGGEGYLPADLGPYIGE